MTRTKSTLLILLAVLLSPMAANADPIFLDPTDPVSDNSYSSSVGYSNFAAMDAVQVFIVSDTGSSGSFESGSVFEGIAGSVINPFYSLTTGALTGTGQWQNFFTGDPIGTLILDFIGWSGGVGGTITNFVGTTTWENGVFAGANFGNVNTLTCPDLSCYDTTPVPEPGTLALLGIGIAAMGLFRRRRTV